MVREKPILFSGEMVRAILDVRKTQTRRVAKLNETLFNIEYPTVREAAIEAALKISPYRVGDRLWVRENFWALHDTDSDDYRTWSCGPCLDIGEQFHPGVQYVATPESEEPPERAKALGINKPGSWWEAPPDYWDGNANYKGRGEWQFHEWQDGFYSKHPSIHMPRWASRLTLEVTSVRVERLQDISSADCVAEGLRPTLRNGIPVKERFRELWDRINGKKHPWSSNPWVWVIEFKRA